MHKNNLRFNFGFLIESPPGTSSDFEFDYPEMQIEESCFTPLSGKFRATRTGEGIYIHGDFHTETEAECIRCLVDASIGVTGTVEELFYYPPSTAQNGEFTIGDNGNLDLGPIIREIAIMALPMQPVCRPDCLGLCADCGINLNEERCDCEKDDIDPRLAKLKELLTPDQES